MEFSNLPNEVKQHIFSFLDHQSRSTVLEVCRQWNALASTAPFMDRIWFRLNMSETKFTDQVKALKHGSRKYRHVTINCETSSTSWSAPGSHLKFVLSPRQSLKLNITELLTAISNVETLSVCAMEHMTASDLIILLSNASNLRHLMLSTYSNIRLQETHSNGLSNISWCPTPGDTSWLDIFTKESGLVLQNVTFVTFLGHVGFSLKVDVFQQMFPNLNWLQVAVRDSSIVNIIDAYKSQLEILYICQITSDLLTLLCDIHFPKLVNLYLRIEHIFDFASKPPRCTLTEELAITKCENFFKNTDHTRNLFKLRLFISNNSIIKMVCANCTSLKYLEVFTTSLDFLEDVSNLRNLKTLLICGTSDDCRLELDANVEEIRSQHAADHSNSIPSLKFVKIEGYFRFTNKPLKLFFTKASNLEVLALVDIPQPEEALRVLSETSPNLRHLKLKYKRQPGEPPRLNFGYLIGKTSLITYSLENVLIDDDSIPKWTQKAPNLSTIVLANCKTLSAAHLTMFCSHCPKLRQIELKNCRKITTQELIEIQEKLPHVVIIYDTNKTYQKR